MPNQISSFIALPLNFTWFDSHAHILLSLLCLSLIGNLQQIKCCLVGYWYEFSKKHWKNSFQPSLLLSAGVLEMILVNQWTAYCSTAVCHSWAAAPAIGWQIGAACSKNTNCDIWPTGFHGGRPGGLEFSAPYSNWTDSLVWLFPEGIENFFVLIATTDSAIAPLLFILH